MNSQNIKCSHVQENIAWGRALSEDDQAHVLTCSSCSAIALDFEEIDSVIKSEVDFVPIGFADNVMKKILTTDTPELSFLENLKEIFSVLANHQVLCWGIGGTSFLIAFAAH